MDMYAFVIKLIAGFLDILPKDTISPNGREKISVTAKICMLVPMPLIS